MEEILKSRHLKKDSVQVSDKWKMSVSDWVKIYENVVTDEFCEKYINSFFKESPEKLTANYRKCQIYSKLYQN